MSGSIAPNLILSLVFGVGQIAVGGGLAWYGLAPARWRQWRPVLAGVAGAWFFVSGVCELIISGMELSRGLGGGPSAAAFAQARALADGALFAATGALAVGLAAYLIARALIDRRTPGRVESERGR
jgi:hypothetical protein